MDTTYFRVNIPFHIEHLYWSTHYHTHCLKYEVVCSLSLPPVLVRVAGPEYGRKHDKTIAAGLLQLLTDAGETALADAAYIGDPHFVTPFRRNQILHQWQNRWNILIQCNRYTVENIIRRYKVFGIFQTPFRHDLRMHDLVFAVVTQIIQLRLLVNSGRVVL